MKKMLIAIMGMLLMFLLVPETGVHAEEAEPREVELTVPTLAEFKNWVARDFDVEFVPYGETNSFYYDLLPDNPVGTAQKDLYENIRDEIIFWNEISHNISHLSDHYYGRFIGNKYLDAVLNSYGEDASGINTEFTTMYNENRTAIEEAYEQAQWEKGNYKNINMSQCQREYNIHWLEEKGNPSFDDYYEECRESMFADLPELEFVDGILPDNKRTVITYNLAGEVLTKDVVKATIEYVLLDCPYFTWTMEDISVAETGSGYTISFKLNDYLSHEENYWHFWDIYATNIMYYGEGAGAIIEKYVEFEGGFAGGDLFNKFLDGREALACDTDWLEAFFEAEYSDRPYYPDRAYYTSDSTNIWNVALWFYRYILNTYELVEDNRATGYENTFISDFTSEETIGFEFKNKTALAYTKLYSILLTTNGVRNYIARGTFDGKARYWNVICLGNPDEEGTWYQCDIAFDDLGGNNYFENPTFTYAHFCIPANKFFVQGQGKEYHPTEPITSELCTSTSYEWTFASRYASYGADSVDDSNVETFIREAEQAQPDEYIYYLFDASENAKWFAGVIDVPESEVVKVPAGYEVRYRSGKFDDPAVKMFTSIGVTKIVPRDPEDTWTELPWLIEKLFCEVEFDSSYDGSYVFEIAAKPKECDMYPQYNWEVVELLIGSYLENGDEGRAYDLLTISVDDPDIAEVKMSSENKAILIPLADGTATVTLSTALNPELKQIFKVKVGTGTKGKSSLDPTPDYVIWAGGIKDKKSVKIITNITASSWTDDKGKSKNGKVVWISMKAKTTPAFDAKHSLTTKTDAKTIANVNAKGEVSAKGPGFAFIYAVDTGSMTWKEYIVEVKQAATKMTCKDTATGSAIKKLVVEAASGGSLFIGPEVKNGKVSDQCTYKVELAKSADADKLSLGNVTYEDGVISFTYSGLKSNGTKAASVKVNIINIESNKKCSVTIQVVNPVKSVNPSSIDNSALATKNGSCEFTTGIKGADNTATTTDKMKVYVSASEPTASGTKITCTASKEIKATLSKDGTKVTLKASKDAPGNVGIYLACTNSATKTVTFYKLGEAGSAPAAE